MPLFDWLIALTCAALVLLAEYRVVIADAAFAPFPLAASIALLIAVRRLNGRARKAAKPKERPVHIHFPPKKH